MTIKSEENEPNIPRRLFGTNGVRGIYGRELTIPLVIDLTYSLATYCISGIKCWWFGCHDGWSNTNPLFTICC